MLVKGPLMDGNNVLSSHGWHGQWHLWYDDRTFNVATTIVLIVIRHMRKESMFGNTKAPFLVMKQCKTVIYEVVTYITVIYIWQGFRAWWGLLTRVFCVIDIIKHANGLVYFVNMLYIFYEPAYFTLLLWPINPNHYVSKRLAANGCHSGSLSIG